MVRDPQPHSAYKRLETDDEFRTRIGGLPSYLKDKELDDHVWDKYRKQRKFIDDVT